MKLGYIHTNKDEQAKVLQVMKRLSEPVALDELGIGRIRDAFSDLIMTNSAKNSLMMTKTVCLNL
jgi:hypothetical protein